nr:DUF3597 family protein [uncultured Roseococcus sp.]
MSLFSSIMNKIFHRAEAAGPAGAAPAGTTPGAAPVPGAAPGATPGSPALERKDVEAILTEMAGKKGGGGNWRTSIVDLLKLLDLDSSLNARKALAEELNVHAGEHGSAEQNIALSKAVWQQLAQNGGQVPASLRD